MLRRLIKVQAGRELKGIVWCLKKMLARMPDFESLSVPSSDQNRQGNPSMDSPDTRVVFMCLVSKHVDTEFM